MDAPITCRDALLRGASHWRKLARVRERAGEIDAAYVNKTTGETLLVRYSPSITERRLKQARLILEQGDFDWIALIPTKAGSREAVDDPRVEIIAIEEFEALASKAGLVR